MSDPALQNALAALQPHAWQLGAIALCLGLLALCSLSEAALVRVELGRIRQLATEGRRGAQRLEQLVEARQEVLSSLVVLINLCVIVASAYTTEITIRLSGGSERWVPVSALGMILVVLVLCEVTPKTYAVRRAEAVGLAAAPVLAALHVVVRPVAILLYSLSLWILRHLVVPIIGGSVIAGRPSYSDEEMMAMVSAGEAEGDIEEEEKEMIHGVIEFADKVAREVMTPRTDIACIPGQTTLLDAARVSEETGYSRLPVYEKDVDHIVGIVYAKDMVSALQSDGAGMTAVEIARSPVPVIPESKKVSDVLRLMQRDRLHMAIVIDEYGGTAGLVTIEDLIEEIFGELHDEYDVETEPVREVSEETLIVDARVSTDEVKNHFGVTLPEGDYDSVGGFMLDQLGHVPVAGESVTWENMEFIAEEVSENRILRVRVARQPEPESDQEHDETE
jgi:putative hemolysin